VLEQPSPRLCCLRRPPAMDFPIAPVRCDILLYKAPGQARDLITDLFLTLYSDDGTEEHNPGLQVRLCISVILCKPTYAFFFLQLSAPLSLAAYTSPTLLTFRAVWYQIVVNNPAQAGWWPTLNASAMYWAVVSPGDPTKLNLGATNNNLPFNGVVWAGFTLAQLAAKSISTPIAISERTRPAEASSRPASCALRASQTTQPTPPTLPAASTSSRTPRTGLRCIVAVRLGALQELADCGLDQVRHLRHRYPGQPFHYADEHW